MEITIAFLIKIKGTNTTNAPIMPKSMVFRLPSLDATKPAGMAKIKNARENEVRTIEDVPGSIPSIC